MVEVEHGAHHLAAGAEVQEIFEEIVVGTLMDFFSLVLKPVIPHVGETFSVTSLLPHVFVY